MLLDEYIPFRLKNFEMQTLRVESRALKKNPLKDDFCRDNPVLVPKNNQNPLRVVFVLAGYAGNGPKYFGLKTFEDNFVQNLDGCVSRSKAPEALYIFVDAMTFWGGSQFINSAGMGNYEDYIIKELVPLVRKTFNCSNQPQDWCVMGGSSGGYGALHLASRHPEVFATVAAQAPDSFFEYSLLPEVYTALPILKREGGVSGVRKALKEKTFLQKRDAFSTLNALAMGLCYGTVVRGAPRFPVDARTGEVERSEWKRWKAHDPIVFLKKRRQKIKKIQNLYLSVGTSDQYHLQYGTRQIHSILSEMKVPVTYYEFNGTHSDLSRERPHLWNWLSKVWV